MTEKKHLEAVNFLAAQHSEEVRALKKALNRREEELQALITKSDLSKLQIIEKKHLEDVDFLEAQHREEVWALKNALNRREEELEALITKNDSSKLQVIEKKHLEAIGLLEAKHNKVVRDLKKALNRREEELQVLITKSDPGKLQMTEKKHLEAVDLLKAQHREELLALKSALNRREEEFQAHITKNDVGELEIIEKKYLDAVDLLAVQHSKEVKELKNALSRREEELQALTTKNDIEIEKLEMTEKKHFEAVEFLEAQHSEEVRTLKNELSRREEELQDLITKKGVEIGEELQITEKKHLETTEFLEAQHTEEVRALKNALTRREEELQALITKNNIEIGKLQAELNTLNKTISDKNKLISELKIDVRISARKIKELEKDEQCEKDDIGKLQIELNTLNNTITDKDKLIAELKMEVRISTRKIKELEKVEQCEKDSIGKLQMEILEQSQKMTEKDSKIKHLQTNVDLLKQTCSVLDGQLKDFEGAVNTANSSAEALTKDKAEVSKLLITTKETLRVTHIQLNELKSLRIFNEKQIEQLKSQLNSEELLAHNQVSEVTQQLAKSAQVIHNYEMELNEAQLKCKQLESECSSWKDQIENYKQLTTTSRSESSTFLMQIVKLKEANIQLQNGFEEALTNCEQLKATVNQLNENLSSLTAEKLDSNLRFESTIQQQTKLIEHLQKQLELSQTKKSRGIVDRIFRGGENPGTPTKTTPLKSRTLESPMRSRTLQSPMTKIEVLSTKTPTKILTEIQNVTKTKVVVDEDRKKEQCVLLKEEEDSSEVQRTLVYHEDKQLDVHCCLSLLDDLYLIGCVDGLYSINRGLKTKIDGIETVWAISFEVDRDFAIVIEGPQRNLTRVHLGLLRACAEAAECSKPKLNSTRVLQITNAYMFKLKGSYLAIAGEKYLKILQMDQDKFHLKFNIQTPTNVTSMLLTCEQTLLFGTDLVYELDLLNGQVEEFLDTTDNTLSINIANCVQFKQYPLAILDLTSTTTVKKNAVLRREYLVAFPDFAIFLDESGRRARELDIIWSKLPSCIEYREPNLFVEHFTSIEVIQLSCISFTRVTEPSFFAHLKTPKLLGCVDSGSMLVSTTTKNLTEIYKVRYPLSHPQISLDVPQDTSCSSSDDKRSDTSAGNTTGSSY